jgi:hypothetical protein
MLDCKSYRQGKTFGQSSSLRLEYVKQHENKRNKNSQIATKISLTVWMPGYLIQHTV